MYTFWIWIDAEDLWLYSFSQQKECTQNRRGVFYVLLKSQVQSTGSKCLFFVLDVDLNPENYWGKTVLISGANEVYGECCCFNDFCVFLVNIEDFSLKMSGNSGFIFHPIITIKLFEIFKQNMFSKHQTLLKPYRKLLMQNSENYRNPKL